jgi:hypothetical protein
MEWRPTEALWVACLGIGFLRRIVQEVDSVETCWGSDREQVEKRRKDVDRPGEARPPFIDRDSGPRHDQRYAERRLIEEEPMRPLAVITKVFPMVSDHHND